MGTNEWISIPGNNPPVVRQWNPIHVKEFLEANRDCYQFSDRDIGLISEEGVGGFALLGLTEGRLREYGLKRGPAFGVAQLVIDLHNKAEIVGGYLMYLWDPVQNFGQYLDGKDLQSQISKAYNQRTGHGETTKRKCLCLLIDEMQMHFAIVGV
ncbi:hypothetical protein BGX38DRAFT_1146514 [Terfezia claveryi]|nr:hypothetical protein BGX38DRAFT_1146514 [Terfezia claveryi]